MAKTKKVVRQGNKKTSKKASKIDKVGKPKVFLESIFNAITDGITVIDKADNIIYINKSLTHFYGYKKPENLIGKKCYKVFLNKNKRCEYCPTKDIFKTGKPQHSIHSGKDIHGNEVYWEIYFYPIFDDKGKVVNVVEYSRNITREKRLEEEVKEYERRVTDLLSISRDVIVEYDTGMDLTFVSENVRDFLGYTSKEILAADSFFDFLTPSSRELVVKNFKARIAGKRVPQLYEFELVHKNGTIIPVEAHISLRKEGRKVLGLVATVRDISERKKGEVQISLANERLQYLLSSTSAVIYTAQASGNYGATFVSENVAQMVGFESEKFIKYPNFWIEHVHPEDKKRVLNEASRLSKREWIAHEYRFQHRNGTYIWMRDEMKLMRDKDGKPLEIVGYWVDITEHRKAEEALKESEELYRTLAETSPDAVTVTDLDGNITHVSKRTLEVHGFKKAKELLGKNALKLIASEDREKALKNLQKTLKNGVVRNLEYSLLRKDRTQFIGELNAALIKDASGNPKAFIATTRDITERKRAEDALKESEERFRIAFEDGPLGMAIVGSNYSLLKVNKAFCNMLGYIDKELTALTFVDITHPEDIDVDVKLADQVFKGKIPNYKLEKRYLKKNKDILQAQLTATVLRDQEGVPLYGLAMIEDITERKKAEEALKESEEKFRSLAEQSPNMIFINKKGAIVYANEECEKIMGYKKNEFYSPDFDFFKLIAPESIDKVKNSFSKHMKGEEVPPYEYTIITKGGRRIDAIHTSKLIKYEGENAILGIVTDITERKHAEEEIRELKDFSESIVDSMNEGIMILNEEGFVSFMNPMIEKMLGYKRTKLVGEHWEKIIAPDYHRRMRDCYAENLQGEHDRFEAVLLKKNKTELPVMISASPQLKAGTFNGILAVITDISDRRKEEIAREELMKYRMRRGSTYLIKEKMLERGKEVVYELYKNHFKGLIITREHPEKIKKDINLKLPIYWLTNDPHDKKSIRPDFNLLEKVIDDHIDRNSFVLLDRFDYLVTQNNFKEALNFIQHLNERFYKRKAILIISLDPETLNIQELSLLEKESSLLEKRHEEKLSLDLIDLLEFVNKRNSVGESPSYNDVGEEFKITRTTARKRIRELVNRDLIMEKKSGRFKFLVLTERGKDTL